MKQSPLANLSTLSLSGSPWALSKKLSILRWEFSTRQTARTQGHRPDSLHVP